MSTPLENDPQKSPFLHAASPSRKRASSSTSSSPSPSPSSSPSPSPSSSLSSSPSRPLFLRGLLAGLLVVVLALGVWFFLKPAAPVPEKDDAPVVKRSRSVVAPAVTNALPKPRPVATNAAPPVVDNARYEHGVKVVKEQVTTNKNGTIVERLWLADGTTKRKIRPPKPIFENPADQLIAMAVAAKPGQSMPPLPGLSNVDEEFAKSLLSPIVIEESDSEEVKEVKAKVLEAKAYLQQEIKNGGTVREVLRNYQAEMEKIADSHLMAVQVMQKIRNESGDEDAEEFRKRVNESFKLRGIPELEGKSVNGEDAAVDSTRSSRRK